MAIARAAGRGRVAPAADAMQISGRVAQPHPSNATETAASIRLAALWMSGLAWLPSYPASEAAVPLQMHDTRLRRVSFLYGPSKPVCSRHVRSTCIRRKRTLNVIEASRQMSSCRQRTSFIYLFISIPSMPYGVTEGSKEKQKYKK